MSRDTVPVFSPLSMANIELKFLNSLQYSKMRTEETEYVSVWDIMRDVTCHTEIREIANCQLQIPNKPCSYHYYRYILDWLQSIAIKRGKKT